MGGEPGDRPGEEPGGGVFALVGVRLDVGDAAVVVHRAVQVVKSDAAAVAAADLAAQRLPAAAIRDTPLLFDVDVDQLAGAVALVAHYRAGGPVDVGQPRHAVTA